MNSFSNSDQNDFDQLAAASTKISRGINNVHNDLSETNGLIKSGFASAGAVLSTIKSGVQNVGQGIANVYNRNKEDYGINTQEFSRRVAAMAGGPIGVAVRDVIANSGINVGNIVKKSIGGIANVFHGHNDKGTRLLDDDLNQLSTLNNRQLRAENEQVEQLKNTNKILGDLRNIANGSRPSTSSQSTRTSPNSRSLGNNTQSNANLNRSMIKTATNQNNGLSSSPSEVLDLLRQIAENQAGLKNIFTDPEGKEEPGIFKTIVKEMISMRFGFKYWFSGRYAKDIKRDNNPLTTIVNALIKMYEWERIGIDLSRRQLNELIKATGGQTQKYVGHEGSMVSAVKRTSGAIKRGAVKTFGNNTLGRMIGGALTLPISLLRFGEQDFEDQQYLKAYQVGSGLGKSRKKGLGGFWENITGGDKDFNRILYSEKNIRNALDTLIGGDFDDSEFKSVLNNFKNRKDKEDDRKIERLLADKDLKEWVNQLNKWRSGSEDVDDVKVKLYIKDLKNLINEKLDDYGLNGIHGKRVNLGNITSIKKFEELRGLNKNVSVGDLFGDLDTSKSRIKDDREYVYELQKILNDPNVTRSKKMSAFQDLENLKNSIEKGSISFDDKAYTDTRSGGSGKKHTVIPVVPVGLTPKLIQQVIQDNPGIITRSNFPKNLSSGILSGLGEVAGISADKDAKWDGSESVAEITANSNKENAKQNRRQTEVLELIYKLQKDQNKILSETKSGGSIFDGTVGGLLGGLLKGGGSLVGGLLSGIGSIGGGLLSAGLGLASFGLSVAGLAGSIWGITKGVKKAKEIIDKFTGGDTSTGITLAAGGSLTKIPGQITNYSKKALAKGEQKAVDLDKAKTSLEEAYRQAQKNVADQKVADAEANVQKAKQQLEKTNADVKKLEKEYTEATAAGENAPEKVKELNDASKRQTDANKRLKDAQTELDKAKSSQEKIKEVTKESPSNNSKASKSQISKVEDVVRIQSQAANTLETTKLELANAERYVKMIESNPELFTVEDVKSAKNQVNILKDKVKLYEEYSKPINASIRKKVEQQIAVNAAMEKLNKNAYYKGFGKAANLFGKFGFLAQTAGTAWEAGKHIWKGQYERAALDTALLGNPSLVWGYGLSSAFADKASKDVEKYYGDLYDPSVATDMAWSGARFGTLAIDSGIDLLNAGYHSMWGNSGRIVATDILRNNKFVQGYESLRNGFKSSADLSTTVANNSNSITSKILNARIGKIVGKGAQGLGVVYDSYRAGVDFSNGDVTGGLISSSAALTGLAALICASGPAAPILGIAAALIGLVKMGWDKHKLKEAKNLFLKNKGAFTDLNFINDSDFKDKIDDLNQNNTDIYIKGQKYVEFYKQYCTKHDIEPIDLYMESMLNDDEFLSAYRTLYGALHSQYEYEAKLLERDIAFQSYDDQPVARETLRYKVYSRLVPLYREFIIEISKNVKSISEEDKQTLHNRYVSDDGKPKLVGSSHNVLRDQFLKLDDKNVSEKDKGIARALLQRSLDTGKLATYNEELDEYVLPENIDIISYEIFREKFDHLRNRSILRLDYNKIIQKMLDDNKFADLIIRLLNKFAKQYDEFEKYAQGNTKGEWEINVFENKLKIHRTLQHLTQKITAKCVENKVEISHPLNTFDCLDLYYIIKNRKKYLEYLNQNRDEAKKEAVKIIAKYGTDKIFNDEIASLDNNENSKLLEDDEKWQHIDAYPGSSSKEKAKWYEPKYFDSDIITKAYGDTDSKQDLFEDADYITGFLDDGTPIKIHKSDNILLTKRLSGFTVSGKPFEVAEKGPEIISNGVVIPIGDNPEAKIAQDRINKVQSDYMHFADANTTSPDTLEQVTNRVREIVKTGNIDTEALKTDLDTNGLVKNIENILNSIKDTTKKGFDKAGKFYGDTKKFIESKGGIIELLKDGFNNAGEYFQNMTDTFLEDDEFMSGAIGNAGVELGKLSAQPESEESKKFLSEVGLKSWDEFNKLNNEEKYKILKKSSKFGADIRKSLDSKMESYTTSRDLTDEQAEVRALTEVLNEHKAEKVKQITADKVGDLGNRKFEELSDEEKIFLAFKNSEAYQELPASERPKSYQDMFKKDTAQVLGLEKEVDIALSRIIHNRDENKRRYNERHPEYNDDEKLNEYTEKLYQELRNKKIQKDTEKLETAKGKILPVIENIGGKASEIGKNWINGDYSLAKAGEEISGFFDAKPSQVKARQEAEAQKQLDSFIEKTQPILENVGSKASEIGKNLLTGKYTSDLIKKFKSPKSTATSPQQDTKSVSQPTVPTVSDSVPAPEKKDVSKPVSSSPQQATKSVSIPQSTVPTVTNSVTKSDNVLSKFKTDFVKKYPWIEIEELNDDAIKAFSNRLEKEPWLATVDFINDPDEIKDSFETWELSKKDYEIRQASGQKTGKVEGTFIGGQLNEIKSNPTISDVQTQIPKETVIQNAAKPSTPQEALVKSIYGDNIPDISQIQESKNITDFSDGGYEGFSDKPILEEHADGSQTLSSEAGMEAKINLDKMNDGGSAFIPMNDQHTNMMRSLQNYIAEGINNNGIVPGDKTYKSGTTYSTDSDSEPMKRKLANDLLAGVRGKFADGGLSKGFFGRLFESKEEKRARYIKDFEEDMGVKFDPNNLQHLFDDEEYNAKLKEYQNSAMNKIFKKYNINFDKDGQIIVSPDVLDESLNNLAKLQLEFSDEFSKYPGVTDHLRVFSSHYFGKFLSDKINEREKKKEDDYYAKKDSEKEFRPFKTVGDIARNIFSTDGINTDNELVDIVVQHIIKSGLDKYKKYCEEHNCNPLRYLQDVAPIDEKLLPKGYTERDFNVDTVEAICQRLFPMIGVKSLGFIDRLRERSRWQSLKDYSKAGEGSMGVQKWVNNPVGSTIDKVASMFVDGGIENQGSNYSVFTNLAQNTSAFGNALSNINISDASSLANIGTSGLQLVTSATKDTGLVKDIQNVGKVANFGIQGLKKGSDAVMAAKGFADVGTLGKIAKGAGIAGAGVGIAQAVGGLSNPVGLAATLAIQDAKMMHKLYSTVSGAVDAEYEDDMKQAMADVTYITDGKNHAYIESIMSNKELSEKDKTIKIVRHYRNWKKVNNKKSIVERVIAIKDKEFKNSQKENILKLKDAIIDAGMIPTPELKLGLYEALYNQYKYNKENGIDGPIDLKSVLEPKEYHGEVNVDEYSSSLVGEKAKGIWQSFKEGFGFADGGIQPLASGGIVKQPIIGEKGQEAIIPFNNSPESKQTMMELGGVISDNIVQDMTDFSKTSKGIILKIVGEDYSLDTRSGKFGSEQIIDGIKNGMMSIANNNTSMMYKIAKGGNTSKVVNNITYYDPDYTYRAIEGSPTLMRA